VHTETQKDTHRQVHTNTHTFKHTHTHTKGRNAEEDEQDEQDEEQQGRAAGAVALDDSDGDDEEGEEAPTHTFAMMTIRRMIQLIPSNYYLLLVQRRLRQDIRFSNRARVLRQMRTYRTSLVRRSFMPGTTRTGRDGSREGCMGATSKRVILRVLPQPIFLCDTASR